MLNDPAADLKDRLRVFLQVLRYLVRVVAQIRMAALERRTSALPVAVPVDVFRGYAQEADENNSVLVHPELGERLRLKPGDWVWLQTFEEGPRTLARLITDSRVHPEDAILSDALFFNATRGGCDAEQIQISPSLLERLPKAVSFDVSIKRCPKGWDASDIDTLMVEFFSKPRPVGAGNVFSVSVRDYKPELFYSKLDPSVDSGNVWFKVEDLVGAAGHQVDPERRVCFEVSKDQTRVALVSASEGGLPGRLELFQGHHDTFLELERAVQLYLEPHYFNVLHKGKGLLLVGKAGCDELYRAVADSLGLHLIVQNCRELNLPTGNIGQVEGKLKQLVAQALKKGPSLLVLDNIEVLGHDHESTSSEGEDFRLTNCLGSVLSTIPGGQCAVLGVTSSPKSIVPSISRSWLSAACMPLQHLADTKSCLKHHLARLGFYQQSVNIEVPRMGARELRLFVRKAIECYVESQESEASLNRKNLLVQLKNRNGSKLGQILNEVHWQSAIHYLKISNQAVANIPKVYWEDIGGLEEVRKEVLRTVSLPIRFPFLRKSGLKRSGILLYGPPGTGKTLVAKAVATECGLSFISVKGAELLSMYVGQSEENVRDVFIRARQVAPSVIFFDELDALAPSRGQGGDGGGNVSDRVVSQLMAEMDGIEQNLDSSKENAPVFVMAATNRVDLVESALLRPGRFDKLMYVGPCKTDSAKLGVLKALTRNFADDVELETVVQHLPEVALTGADLYGMCAEAWKGALRKRISEIQMAGVDDKRPLQVSMENFNEAAANMRTSVSPEELAMYEQEAKKQNIQ